jgi:hypothetical protein
MTLRQGVITASWEADKREYIAKIGPEAVEGLGRIVGRLTESGWEIASVVALESSSGPTASSTKSNPKSRIAADVLAIFIKRDETGPPEESPAEPA